MLYEDFENKPLPEHTKLDYYECLAKIVLEALFPNDFIDLKIKDKPDLQNVEKEIGIEVTRAINPKQEQNEKLCSKIIHGQIRDKEKAIKKINSSYKPSRMIINGKEIRESDRYNNGILIGIPENDNFDRIVKAFKDKIHKLNEGEYSPFLFNYLFIHSEIFAIQEMINNVIVDMNKFQEKYEKKFYKVFVYVPSELYVLNLENKIGEIKNIKEYQFDWAINARDMIIKYEIEHS